MKITEKKMKTGKKNVKITEKNLFLNQHIFSRNLVIGYWFAP